MAERVGPTVRVNIEYHCNGCQYHKLDADSETGVKYHACHAPSVIEEYSVPQWMFPGEHIHNPCPTRQWLCPYINKDRK